MQVVKKLKSDSITCLQYFFSFPFHIMKPLYNNIYLALSRLVQSFFQFQSKWGRNKIYLYKFWQLEFLSRYWKICESLSVANCSLSWLGNDLSFQLHSKIDIRTSVNLESSMYIDHLLKELKVKSGSLSQLLKRSF